jgi:hypothetical protein
MMDHLEANPPRLLSFAVVLALMSTLEGANPQAKVTGLEELPGKSKHWQ